MDNTNEEPKTEQIQMIPISKITPFKDHPFQVKDDELMQQTIDSIQQVGILTPVILRPTGDDSYEMISGHRRLYAAEHSGLTELPAIVRDMTDDEAVVLMVDSNLQRENILPSERAKAYKMKMDAIKRQAGRPSKNCGQLGHNFFDGKKSRDIVSENSPDSPRQIARFIRLNELNPQLMQLVDEGKMGLTPAVELSYLKKDEQKALAETIDNEQSTPSLSQAQRMKKLSAEGQLNDDSIQDIMSEQKKPDMSCIKLSFDKISRYFPRSYTPSQMENMIIKLLDIWHRNRQRQNER